MKGEHTGPELNAIAWYGGNSGATYAGAIECTGSLWEEKQFESSRCGAQPVRRKAPNRWGFYDLLGNVNEWTGDWYGTQVSILEDP